MESVVVDASLSIAHFGKKKSMKDDIVSGSLSHLWMGFSFFAPLWNGSLSSCLASRAVVQ
jgi:hypothetical protein